MWPAWINGSIGLWLITIAFIPMNSLDSAANNLFLGILSAIAGWKMRLHRPWHGWASIAIGGWLIATLAFPEILTGRYHHWNLTIVGVVLTVFGFSALGGKYSTDENEYLNKLHNVKE